MARHGPWVFLLVGLLAAGACRDRGDRQDREPDNQAAIEGAKQGAEAPDSPPATEGVGDLVGPQEIERALARESREHWFGLFLGGKKIGFASLKSWTEGTQNNESLVWRVVATLKMSEGSEANITETRRYSRRPPYRLQSLTTTESDDSGLIERRYHNGERAMSIETIINGDKRPRRHVAPSEATALAVLAQSAVDPAKLRPGQRGQYVEFDSDKEHDQLTTIEVKSVQSRRIAGISTPVAVLAARDEGEQTVTHSTVAADGVTLQTTIGDGIELRLQEKEVATGDVVGFDYVADAVPVSEALGEPGAIDELRLIASVGSGFVLPNRPDQRVKARPDGRFDLVLRRGPGPAVKPNDRKVALMPSQGIDANHPEIVSRAKEITRGAKGDRERVRLLVRWVYEHLEKDLSTNLSTASLVLERRVGDCTEHSILLAALARAAGIPAREASGLIYMGDEVGRFGWHAWVEVELDGFWQAVDPSWDEVQANATHITLGVGSDSDWVATMGSMSLQVATPGP